MTTSESSPSPALPLWDFPVPVHANEDLASIIVRVAEDHFHRANDLFARYFERSPDLLADVGNYPQILDQLDVLTGYGKEFIHSLGWQRQTGKKVIFRGQALPTTWIDEARRVAPGVLANDGEHPYIRLSWRFPAIPFDIDTREMLINRCPSCVSPLTWRQVRSVYHCQNCQFDLRDCRPIFAHSHTVEPVLRLAAHIGLAPGEKIVLPEPFMTEDTAVTLLALEWCAWFGGLMSLDQTKKSAFNASRGIALAESWPSPLKLAVDLMMRQVQSSDVSFETLQYALKSLPTRRMSDIAMVDLSGIIQSPKYQNFVPTRSNDRRWKYIRT